MTWYLHYNDPSFTQHFEQFLNTKRGQSDAVDDIVATIIADVKEKGDEALLHYTNKFDACQFTNVQDCFISQNDIEQAYNGLNDATKKAVAHTIERIMQYHEHLVPNDVKITDAHGNILGATYHPVDACALYVPGGKAAYPSSVIMNAVPAIVAGVPNITIVTPTPSHKRNDIVLAAAHALNINNIITIGGASAVAAMAYGTQTINKVDVITGPGNSFVATAKKQLYGVVGIDMIAGPSEILVVAEHQNNPRHVAIDLLSQAEHDEEAQAILITDSADLAYKVEDEINQLLEELPRKDIAKASWDKHGAIIMVDDIATQAPNLINAIAPEHCELMLEHPADITPLIKHAGALFIGRYTPEAIGDYIAGPNHVLPTNRNARFASSLSVEHFMKRSSLIECSAQGLQAIKNDAIIMAELEGLHAHALSMKLR